MRKRNKTEKRVDVFSLLVDAYVPKQLRYGARPIRRDNDRKAMLSPSGRKEAWAETSRPCS